MNRAWSLAIIFALAVAARAEETSTTFRVQGGELGKNVQTVLPDGSVTSTTTFKLGANTTTLILNMERKNGAFSKVTMDQQAGPNHVVGTFENGKFTMSGSSKMEKPYPMPNAFVSPFIPYSWQTLIDATGGKAGKVKAMFLDNFNEVEFDLKMADQIVSLQGGPTKVQVWTTEIAKVGLEFFAVKGTVVGMRIKQQSFEATRDDYAGIFEDPLSKFPELSQPTFKKLVSETASIPMRDGKKLVCTVVRPEGDGKLPAILTRTPYGRALSAFEATKYASRGYAYISQDVRGKGDSEGDFDPLVNEMQDGKDTLDWIAAQPWSDQKIGMIGASYGGFVQWAAAATRHPALKCIVPQVSPPQPTKNFPWENGSFMLMGNIWWARIVKDKTADMSQVTATLTNLAQMNTMPLSQVDDAFLKQDVPFYNDWVKRDTIEEWPTVFTTAQVAACSIPALHISGYWDGDGVGTMLHWNARRAAKRPQALIFGPWSHAFNSSRTYADQDYGPQALLELDSVYLRWFDAYLKGKTEVLEKEPRVRFFVSGSNRWVHASDWPVPGAKSVTYYLGGSPDGKGKAGTLTAAPTTNRPAKLDYDPNKIKLANVSAAVSMNADSNSLTVPLKSFKDTLVYRGEKLAASQTFAGTLNGDFFVSSTGKDATFFVAVFDERPDGKLTLLGLPGTQRVSYLGGSLKPLEPNKVYRVRMSPWWFAHEFKPGHRLVISLSSNRFPNFARNPGTGESDETAVKMRAVTNSVYADKKRPSRITLWKLP